MPGRRFFCEEEQALKTGIVLEGGALRTMFSSGVCDALLEEELTPDYVIGVSAGIAYGVSYVSRQRGRNLTIARRFVRDGRYMGAGNLFRPKNRAYFGMDFTYDTIPNRLVPFDYAAFAAFPGEVEAVVTNLNTGEAMYRAVPRGDRTFQLLRATCAMPLLFPVYSVDGAPCLDGGAADPIPFERAFAMGCDRVLVVLTRERAYHRAPEKLQPLIRAKYGRAYPRFCETMERRAQRYEEARARLFSLEREGKAMLLAPESTEGFSRLEKNVEKIEALWRQGYELGQTRAAAVRAFWAGA